MNSINKYAIQLSYLGTNYSGWQIQDNAKSVQGMIMEGLYNILNQNIALIVGAGRTDSGVHAVNYFAHFEFASVDTIDLTHRLNRFLPNDIVVHSIYCVTNDFHARFSAVSRTYEYWISTVKDPFLINRSYVFFKKLDLDLMNQVSVSLLGENNFSAFSKSKPNNPICHVYAADWIRSKNMVIFSIKADRFLYNMVRCIVGTLIDVGLNKINLKDFMKIANSHDRSLSGSSVPAHGLYLMNVGYKKDYKIEEC